MENQSAAVTLDDLRVHDPIPPDPVPLPGARLAQAFVLEASDRGVRAFAGDRVIDVKMALGYDYRPAAGDVLLVIGQEDLHFAIGVIRGTGRSILSFPGDAEIRAPRGRMRLFAGKGVAIHAPEVSVRASRWNLIADTLVEKAAEAYHFVTGLFQLRAGSRHTVIQGQSFEKAERVYVRAEQEVSVDGKTIQLG
jgi:hypothetical protein